MMRRLIAASLFGLLIVVTVSSGAQTFTTIYQFCTQNGCPDGETPNSPLVEGKDGNFYGTTYSGGTNFGTVFTITPEGVLTTLHNFAATDGDFPGGALLQGTDGDFYGTTGGGGAHNFGTVFKITSDGTLTTLYSFCPQYPCPDGSFPDVGLVQATDGNFYGTTNGGGINNWGTVFKITPQGTLTTLHQFNSSDGYNPLWLVQGTDGNFYGTTFYGGTSGWGTVFKMTPQGVLTTLHSFCAQTGCPDGKNPEAGLVQASDGNFYGTTLAGGAGFYGTVFRITPGGVFTTLHSFVDVTDGASPTSGLVQAADGKLYGTTEGGGAYSFYGTIYTITTGGEFTTIYNLNYPNGMGGNTLMQATDGSFYGTTVYGGNGNGTVFRFVATNLLSVTKSGMGVVRAVDGHIYCGTMCSYAYDIGTSVTLSAIPTPGYTFTGWTGCDNVNGSYCSVTMTSPKAVAATFTSANVTLTSLTFKPTYVKGGQLSSGTLTLSAAAPPGGVTVALGSDHPGVAHPPSFVFVPAMQSSVGFAVNTFPVKSNTSVSITATAGASHVSGTLTVGTVSLPPSLK